MSLIAPYATTAELTKENMVLYHLAQTAENPLRVQVAIILTTIPANGLVVKMITNLINNTKYPC